MVQDKPKTQKFHQRRTNGLLALNQSHDMCLILYKAVFLEMFAAIIPVKLLLEVKCCFKTSKQFVKLLPVSVPDICGLYSVQVMSFFELRFFGTAAPMTGCFADEFADGTAHLRSMLVHAFSSGIEIS